MSFENLIGTAPNQIPSNTDLGDLAYQNRESVNISGGTATLDVGNIKKIENTTEISEVEPTLLLDFAKTKTLDPRITFTRASTGTYYDGKTYAKAEENLVLYSQEFDNAYWTKTNATVIANATTAPDGTITADTIAATAGTSIIPFALRFNLSCISGLDYVISFFAKAGTYSILQITNIGFQSSSAYANFDLSAGTVGVSANCTASIQNEGDGWYRCIIGFTATNTGNGGIYAVLAPSTSANRFQTWNPAGTETVFLWGAQLEQRSSVTAYTPTTNQPITKYIPALQTAAANIARFDHNPLTGESLGFLVEEQRTNLLTYSEQFDNAAWGKFNANIISNTVIAPDGTLTGDKLIADTTPNTTHSIGESFSKSAITYTGSVYVKAAECDRVAIGFSGVSNWNGTPQALFNLSTGEVDLIGTSTIAKIKNVGNGWYKCSITSTSINTVGSSLTIAAIKNDSINIGAGGVFLGFNGDGYSGIYIWGAQVEAGAFATSYIKTEASQITRSADAASMTGTNFSSWYRQDEGTVYAEATAFGGGATAYLSDGTSNNYITLQPNKVQIDTNDQNQVFQSNLNTLGKVTVALARNDYAHSINSNNVYTDDSLVLPLVNRLSIGSANGSFQLDGTIKKLAYYPARLSNEELQEMTE